MREANSASRGSPQPGSHGGVGRAGSSPSSGIVQQDGYLPWLER